MNKKAGLMGAAAYGLLGNVRYEHLNTPMQSVSLIGAGHKSLPGHVEGKISQLQPLHSGEYRISGLIF